MDRDARDVRRTYDRIAAHFSATREYAWPEVEEFLDGRTGSVSLDLGCGNGRHTEALAPHVEHALGLDASAGLLAEAQTRATERGFDASWLQSDASRLPLHGETIDLAIYVATLHHLPTRDARVRSLAELRRVLTPGGRALVSAWSTEHDRFDATGGFDTTIDWTLPNGETVPRFYHIYDPAEFDADLERAGLHVVSSEVSSGNCYAVVASED